MRALFDPLQLLRLLVRPQQLAAVLAAWEAGALTPVATPDLLERYDAALSDEVSAPLIDGALLEAFGAHLLHDLTLAEPVMPDVDGVSAEDAALLAAAIGGGAAMLISGSPGLRRGDAADALARAGCEVLLLDELLRELEER